MENRKKKKRCILQPPKGFTHLDASKTQKSTEVHVWRSWVVQTTYGWMADLGVPKRVNTFFGSSGSSESLGVGGKGAMKAKRQRAVMRPGSSCHASNSSTFRLLKKQRWGSLDSFSLRKSSQLRVCYLFLDVTKDSRVWRFPSPLKNGKQTETNTPGLLEAPSSLLIAQLRALSIPASPRGIPPGHANLPVGPAQNRDGKMIAVIANIANASSLNNIP